jgi:hypothetical protein
VVVDLVVLNMLYLMFTSMVDLLVVAEAAVLEEMPLLVERDQILVVMVEQQ